MVRIDSRSIIFYLFGMACLGIGAILLPHYLGTLIAGSQWRFVELMFCGVILMTLYFVEGRFLILCTVLSLMVTGGVMDEKSAVSFSSVRWAFLGALAFRGTMNWITGRVPKRFREVDFWAISFIGLAFFSFYYSILPALTLQKSAAISVFYLAVFWGVASYAREEAAIVSVVRDLLKMGAVIVVAGFFFIGQGRYSGIFGNPNAVGAFSTFFMPLAISFYFYERKPWMMTLIVLIVLGLILSDARAGILGTMVGTLYVLWYRFRNLRLPLAVVVLFLLVTLSLFCLLFGAAWFFEYIRFNSLSTGSGRMDAWREILRLICLRPWTGFGFGTEEFLFYKFDIQFEEHAGAYAHNVYLGLVSQLGIVGACFFFGPLAIFWIRNAFHIDRSTSSSLHWLHPALNSILLGGLIHATFESWIYSAGNFVNFVFWMIFILQYQLNRINLHVPKNAGTAS